MGGHSSHLTEVFEPKVQPPRITAVASSTEREKDSYLCTVILILVGLIHLHRWLPPSSGCGGESNRLDLVPLVEAYCQMEWIIPQDFKCALNTRKGVISQRKKVRRWLWQHCFRWSSSPQEPSATSGRRLCQHSRHWLKKSWNRLGRQARTAVVQKVEASLGHSSNK